MGLLLTEVFPNFNKAKSLEIFPRFICLHHSRKTHSYLLCVRYCSRHQQMTLAFYIYTQANVFINKCKQLSDLTVKARQLFWESSEWAS